MAKLDRGEQIHQQYLVLHRKMDDHRSAYQQALKKGEQYRELFWMMNLSILIYWSHVQKYLWLKSCGYEHRQIRHWLNPFYS